MDQNIIAHAKLQLSLYLSGSLAEESITVDEITGIEEGPEVGDEIKIFEATFDGKVYTYDENDQKTTLGKVSEQNTVLHLAMSSDGYHIFFATYDDTADLFGDYIFLGLIPDTKPNYFIKPGPFEYIRSILHFVKNLISKPRL